MKRHLMLVALVASLSYGSQVMAGGVPLFSEDFESVVLGPSVNSRLGFPISTVVAGTPDFAPVPDAFTHWGPAGWTLNNNWNNFNKLAGDPNGGVDLNNPEYATGDIVGNIGLFNAGDPNNGVAEWEGWSFANKDFWVEAAGDQDRSQFTSGSGTVLIADGDEYDDLGTGRGGGYINSGVSTGTIDVTAQQGQPVFLNFDSSWRAEGFDDSHSQNAQLTANYEALDPGVNVGNPDLNNSTAAVWATFDGATPGPFRIDIWDSNPGSPSFKDDNTNEQVVSTAFVPADATTVKFTFGYLNAANDWWWAIDNLNLKDVGDTSLWSEDFETVPLGPSVNEQRSTVGGLVQVPSATPGTSPRPDSFTHTAPSGWMTRLGPDMDGTPALDPVSNNDVGIFEFEAWSFIDAAFWAFNKDSGRSEFTNASGKFAVADGDLWDNLGDPDGGSSTYPLQVFMTSPEIDLQGNTANVELSFDSSWRQEGDQEVRLTADFGSGPVEILHWTTDNKPDATNETVVLSTAIPAGATTVQYEFEYRGFDDWWWGIDNIAVAATAIPEPTSMFLAAISMLGIGFAGRRRR